MMSPELRTTRYSVHGGLNVVPSTQKALGKGVHSSGSDGGGSAALIPSPKHALTGGVLEAPLDS